MIREYDNRVDYPGRHMSKLSLAADPFDQFSIWYQKIKRCSQDVIFESNAMSLATVSDTGQPHVRIVLMKEITSSGVVFFTNYNSVKGSDLSANSKASVMFWWPSVFQQIRIEGEVRKIAEEESDVYFAKRPLESQVAAVVSRQSEPILSREALLSTYQSLLEQQKIKKTIQRPSNWGGYCLQPHRYEFWQGAEHRLHDRFEYTQVDGQWCCQRLSP